jgi:hypothetical protein
MSDSPQPPKPVSSPRWEDKYPESYVAFPTQTASRLQAELKANSANTQNGQGAAKPQGDLHR